MWGDRKHRDIPIKRQEIMIQTRGVIVEVKSSNKYWRKSQKKFPRNWLWK